MPVTWDRVTIYLRNPKFCFVDNDILTPRGAQAIKEADRGDVDLFSGEYLYQIHSSFMGFSMPWLKNPRNFMSLHAFSKFRDDTRAWPDVRAALCSNGSCEISTLLPSPWTNVFDEVHNIDHYTPFILPKITQHDVLFFYRRMDVCMELVDERYIRLILLMHTMLDLMLVWRIIDVTRHTFRFAWGISEFSIRHGRENAYANIVLGGMLRFLKYIGLETPTMHDVHQWFESLMQVTGFRQSSSNGHGLLCSEWKFNEFEFDASIRFDGRVVQCRNAMDISCHTVRRNALEFSLNEEYNRILSVCDNGDKKEGGKQLKAWLLKNESLRLKVDDAGAKGLGLFAKVRIPQYQIIFFYTGKLITQKRSEEEDEVLRRLNKHMYFADRSRSEDDKMVLDAMDFGAISRYANHSCRPNTIMIFDSRALDMVVLLSVKPIGCGEEITFDYHRKARIWEHAQQYYNEYVTMNPRLNFHQVKFHHVFADRDLWTEILEAYAERFDILRNKSAREALETLSWIHRNRHFGQQLIEKYNQYLPQDVPKYSPQFVHYIVKGYNEFKGNTSYLIADIQKEMAEGICYCNDPSLCSGFINVGKGDMEEFRTASLGQRKHTSQFQEQQKAAQSDSDRICKLRRRSPDFIPWTNLNLPQQPSNAANGDSSGTDDSDACTGRETDVGTSTADMQVDDPYSHLLTEAQRNHGFRVHVYAQNVLGLEGSILWRPVQF